VAVAQNSRLGSGGSAHRQLSGGGWVDHGHHALFRSANFLAVGGYDETFPANEDAEFDVRLVRAGGRIWLEDSGAILYLPRRSAIKLFVQYVKYGEGRARTLLRHRSQAKLRQLLPIMVAPAVVLLAPALWQPVLALPALTWAGACMLYGAWLGAKTRQWCPWMSGPVAMIMHFGWSLGFWLRLAQGPGPGFVSALGNRPSPIDPPAPSATTMEIAGSH
jgi:succinoglycan biosynthesis protein ExoA